MTITGWLSDISLELNSSYWWFLLWVLITGWALLVWFHGFFKQNSLFSKTTLVFNYPRSAFKRTCRGLPIDTNFHFHRHILRGDNCKNCWFFAKISKSCSFLEIKLQDISELTTSIWKIIFIIIDCTKAFNALSPKFHLSIVDTKIWNTRKKIRLIKLQNFK